MHGRILDVASGPGIVTSAPRGRRARGRGPGFDARDGVRKRKSDVPRPASYTNVLFKQRFRDPSRLCGWQLDDASELRGYRFIIFSNPKNVLLEMLRVLKVGGTVAVADVVSAEDAGKAALQNAIEVLRDPSRMFACWSGSELVDLITRAGVAIDRRESWDKAREFEEWAGIVANPERCPLRNRCQRALAKPRSGRELWSIADAMGLRSLLQSHAQSGFAAHQRGRDRPEGLARAGKRQSHHRARSAAFAGLQIIVGPRPGAPALTRS